MKTLLHVTSDDEADCRHAIRSASLLQEHDELTHENVTLLPHRRAIRLVAPDSPVAADLATLCETGVTVKAGETCFDANGSRARHCRGSSSSPVA